MHTQELGAAHSLHGRTIDGQRSMLSVHSPEVNDNDETAYLDEVERLTSWCQDNCLSL